MIGSEAGVRAVIDTTLGGALARRSAAATRSCRAQRPGGALAHLYVEPAAARASRAARHGAGAARRCSAARAPGERLARRRGRARCALDADTLAPARRRAGGLLAPAPKARRRSAQLPGESWLALGLGNAGATLGADVAGPARAARRSLAGASRRRPARGALSLGGAARRRCSTPLERPRREHAAGARATTPAGWARPGSSPPAPSLLELKAAVVIASNDAGRLAGRRRQARRAAAQRRATRSQPVTIPGTEAAVVGARCTGLPLSSYIAAGRDSTGRPKFVLGLGEASVAAALTPAEHARRRAAPRAAAATRSAKASSRA